MDGGDTEKLWPQQKTEKLQKQIDANSQRKRLYQERTY